ncbi:TcfC E-set like domain-containing protein [Salmonella enterica]|nr:TcfC E-set like domain-containing protein [Salmonella enterica subsp. enterica serovar Poona]
MLIFIKAGRKEVPECSNKVTLLLLLVGFSFFSCIPSHARGIPSGFESLSLGQDQYLNVNSGEENDGVFAAFVTPESLTFRQPEALLAKLPLENVSEENRKKILAKLSSPLPRHDGSWHFVPDKDGVGVVYNEQQQSVLLLINPAWMGSSNRQFYQPSYNSERAFVSQQSFVFSHSNRTDSLGGSGYFAQGISDKSYLRGDWTAFHNENKWMGSNSQFLVNNLFIRGDILQRMYIQGGRMDGEPLNSRLGGDFALSLLPLNTMNGIRLGSTNAYINNTVQMSSVPLTVMLTQAARVDVYRGERLLVTSYEDAGIHDIDTSNFPAGSYPVTLKIYQNGHLSRQETQFFENLQSDNVGSDQIQWFAQVGKDTTTEAYNAINNTNDQNITFAGGIKTGITRYLNWTAAIMNKSNSEFLSENDLALTIPTSLGNIGLKSGYLSQGVKGVADSEQINWNNGGSALYLYRYHANSDKASNRDSYESYSANASTTLSNWTASLGYTLTQSEQRYWYPFQDNMNLHMTEQDMGYRQARSRYTTSNFLFSLETNINHNGWDFWPRVGFFSGRGGGQGKENNGIFFMLSLSQNTALTSGISSNTTASINYKQRASDNDVSLRQQWVWNEADYRSLDVGVTTGGKNHKGATITGEWNGTWGSSGVSAEHTYSSDFTDTVLSGHYNSSFAVSSTGLVWGSNSGNESTLTGVIVDACDSSDEKVNGPVAKIDSTSGRGTYLNEGSQTFIPAYDYSPTQIEISDAGVHGANGSLIRGGGKHSVFLLPGHVSFDRLSASATYVYVGKLTVNGKNLLNGGKILNANVPDVGLDGSFIAEFSSTPDKMYVLKSHHFYVCPLKFKEGFNGIRQAGVLNCSSVDTTAIPPKIKNSKRVTNLLAANK